MRYEIQAVDNLLQFDFYDDINIIQGESKADIFTINIPLEGDTLNLGELSYTLKGTVGSYEMREVLQKDVSEDTVKLTWSPNLLWTSIYGTLRLTLIATDSDNDEELIAKWVAPEGLKIQRDIKGTNNVEIDDVAYQLLHQMQDVASDFINEGFDHNTVATGRDAEDAHPIEAITGLRKELDSKANGILDDVPAGNILAVSPNKEVVDSGHCCSDFFMMKDLDEFAEHVRDRSFTHRQDSASAEWHIHHTLGKMPSVTVVDSAGNVVIGDILYKDDNYIVIKFQGAFSGRAYLN